MKNLHMRESNPVGRVLAGLALAAVSATVHAEASFAEAMERYERGHWSASYADLASLADQGHAEAARIALLMQRHGVSLYQIQLIASPQQIAAWAALASRQGAPRIAAAPR